MARLAEVRQERCVQVRKEWTVMARPGMAGKAWKVKFRQVKDVFGRQGLSGDGKSRLVKERSGDL